MVKVVIIFVCLIGEWFLYFKILGRIMNLGWAKPEWLNSLLVFGTPIFLAAVAGLVSHSWLIGLAFLTPLAIPLFLIGGFLILWICEQWTIREMSRGRG